jgi:hypothetical protein
LRLSFHLPIVVEIVDTKKKINGFLPELDKMMSSALVTLEKIKVLQYKGWRNAQNLRERVSRDVEQIGDTPATAL